MYISFCVLYLYSVVYVVSFMYRSFRAHPFQWLPSPSCMGWGLFWAQIALALWLDDISQGPKSLDFQGPTPYHLPL